MSSENPQQHERQRLYEKWVKKPAWSANETAALILGLDPDKHDESPRTRDLEELVKSDVIKGTLERAGGSNETELFVNPVAAYQWARRQGLELAVELENLMEFVIKMTLPAVNPDFQELPEIMPSADIERLLGACLSVMMNYPQECMGKSGKVSIEKMLKLLDENAGQLFENHYPALSGTVIRDILKSWQAKLQGN